MNKEEYIKRIITFLQKINDVAIVGVSGCSYINEKINRKCKRDNHIRVYMNGGFILGVPLEGAEFTFIEEEYTKLDNDGMPKYFSSKSKIIELNVLKKDIASIYNKKKEYTEDDENKMKKVLTDYLALVRECTKKKFDSKSEATNKKTQEKKERYYQMQLFNQMLKNDDSDYLLFDIEFKSILEMNADIKKIEEWILEGHNFREKFSEKKDENSKDSIYVKCGKPDFVAVNEKGFVIMEFKSNKEACEGGSADLGGHNEDFGRLIKYKNNLVLINELKERLRVMKKFGLVNLSPKHKKMIDDILDMESEQINIDVKYLLQISERNTMDKYKEIAQRQGISLDEMIFV